MKTIQVTDSKLITYLNYKGIRPVSSIRDKTLNKVVVTYQYDESFNDAKHDFMSDTVFSSILDAKHKTDDLLRNTL